MNNFLNDKTIFFIEKIYEIKQIKSIYQNIDIRIISIHK